MMEGAVSQAVDTKANVNNKSKNNCNIFNFFKYFKKIISANGKMIILYDALSPGAEYSSPGQAVCIYTAIAATTKQSQFSMTRKLRAIVMLLYNCIEGWI